MLSLRIEGKKGVRKAAEPFKIGFYASYMQGDKLLIPAAIIVWSDGRESVEERFDLFGLFPDAQGCYDHIKKLYDGELPYLGNRPPSQ